VSRINEHLKKSLLAGLVAGGPLAAYGYFGGAKPISLLIGGGIACATGMFVGWFAFRAELKRRARGFQTDNHGPEQTRIVHYAGSCAEAVDDARRALAAVRKVKNVAETSSPITITARTGTTFESFGEKIVLKFTPTGTGTNIEISSKPRIWTTLEDWGKGIENVETVVQYLVTRGARRRVA
jgi:hypothetical protein